MRRHRLPANNCSSSSLRIFAGGQRAQNHRANHPRRLTALLRDQARYMALRDVGQLMAHHSGKFIAIAYKADQPQVHAQIAAWQRKSVDGAVTNQKQLPGKARLKLRRKLAARPSCCHQGLPDSLQIVGQYRIVNIVGIAVNAGGDAVPNPPLSR